VAQEEKSSSFTQPQHTNFATRPLILAPCEPSRQLKNTAGRTVCYPFAASIRSPIWISNLPTFPTRNYYEPRLSFSWRHHWTKQRGEGNTANLGNSGPLNYPSAELAPTSNNPSVQPPAWTARFARRPVLHAQPKSIIPLLEHQCCRHKSSQCCINTSELYRELVDIDINTIDSSLLR
jgi:hypothetical protein